MSILSTLWDEVLGGPKPEKCQDRLGALNIPQSPSNSVDLTGSPVNSPKPSWEDDFEKRRRSVECGRVSSQPPHSSGTTSCLRGLEVAPRISCLLLSHHTRRVRNLIQLSMPGTTHYQSEKPRPTYNRRLPCL
ncbi:unnamed protein product [Closterium sp. Yama58-4]|nr:unnamed protein product [Closterium sp. Yama58-4]